MYPDKHENNVTTEFILFKHRLFRGNRDLEKTTTATTTRTKLSEISDEQKNSAACAFKNFVHT